MTPVYKESVYIYTLTKLVGVLQAQPLIAVRRTNRQFMDIGTFDDRNRDHVAGFALGPDFAVEVGHGNYRLTAGRRAKTFRYRILLWQGCPPKYERSDTLLPEIS